MAPHSSTPAWKVPWTGEPGGLKSMGSQRVGRLSIFTFTFHFHALEKEMETHSSVLAWRIPGMVEPGGLPSVGLHRVGNDWSNLGAARVLRISEQFEKKSKKFLRFNIGSVESIFSFLIHNLCIGYMWTFN